jgi:hypothetical protein
LPKERQAFRRNVMTTMYRGVRTPAKTETTTKTHFSGIYRGTRFSTENIEKASQPTSGIYRGVKWGS